MTLDEARRTTQRLLDRPIEVSVTPTSTKVPMSGRDAGVDLVRGLERAYLVGRTGALPTRISERIAASQGRVVVALPARDSGVVAELLADARSRQEREPVNAEFEVRSGQLQVVPGIPGTRVDECAFLEVLGEAATSARASQRVAVATTVRVRAPITSADLGRVASTAQEWTSRDIVGVAPGVRLALSREDVASLLTVRDGELAVAGERVAGALSRLSVPVSAPRNARFVVVNGRVTVVDGAPGTQVDASATALALEGALKSGSDRFEIALSRREPDIARADLEAMGITRQLSSFTTHFRLGQDGRDVNINLAASAIRGTVVNIGGVFSLNAVTGPRNKGTGYKEALVFSHGKVVPGIGGGVCQVSSTTYQAALRAGLRIVERRSHSMAVSYLAPGLDATTYYPTVDLKFQNTTRGPILMWTEVRGNALIVSVYGSGARPTVQIKTVMRKTMQPRKRVVYVTSLPHNRQVVEEVGRPGYVVTSYRLVYQSGRVVRREELATDEYQPRDWIIRVGI
jgi:vancomycin resistance protein YoaR